MSDGECKATNLEVSAFLALPACDAGTGGFDGLDTSWLRLTFPDMDPPDIPDVPGIPDPPTIPDTPSLPGGLFEAPSFDTSRLSPPRFAVNFKGKLTNCGLCGFRGLLKKDRPAYSVQYDGLDSRPSPDPPPPPSPSPPPKAIRSSFLPKALLDQLTEFSFPWEFSMNSLPTLTPWAISGFDPDSTPSSATPSTPSKPGILWPSGFDVCGRRRRDRRLQLDELPVFETQSSLEFGDRSIPLTAVVQGLQEPDVGSGVALVLQAAANFGDKLFGVEAITGVTGDLVVVKHFTELTVTSPTSLYDLGGVTGDRSKGYTRAYLAVTVAEIDIGVLIDQILIKPLGMDFTFPFELPKLTNLRLTLAKTLSGDLESYDPTHISPDFLPASVQIASADGLWYSADIQINSEILRILFCSVMGVELSDGSCLAESITIAGHVELPTLGSTGVGKLASSWIRTSFPGMDGPDFDCSSGVPSPFTSTQIESSWSPSTSDWSSWSGPKPALPRLSVNLDGELFDCGFCGFIGYPDRSVPPGGSPPPPRTPSALRTDGGLPNFFPKGLLDDLGSILFKNVPVPTLHPFTISGFDPSAMKVTVSSLFSFNGGGGGGGGGAAKQAPLTGVTKAFGSPDIGEGTLFVMDTSIDFGENVFGLSYVDGLKTSVVALRHLTDLSITLPSCSFEAFDDASCDTGAITGDWKSGYSRGYFAVTVETISLDGLVKDLLSSVFSNTDIELPFQLPELKDVTLILAKTFPGTNAEYTEYDASSLSPSVLPESVRLASRDGLWLSTKVEVESMIPRLIICLVLGVEIDDLNCDVPELQATAYIELPAFRPPDFVVPSVPDVNLPGTPDISASEWSLHASFVRFGFPGLDPPDLPSPDSPDLPDGTSIPSVPAMPKFAVNFRGESFKCGYCGFSGFSGARSDWTISKPNAPSAGSSSPTLSVPTVNKNVDGLPDFLPQVNPLRPVLEEQYLAPRQTPCPSPRPSPAVHLPSPLAGATRRPLGNHLRRHHSTIAEPLLHRRL